MILFMDRQRAARAVAARRGELGMTQLELAETAGVDSKTIGNLERRGRWPIAKNRARIEKALHWPVGEMERIASDDGTPEEPEDPVMRAIREQFPDEATRERVADIVLWADAVRRSTESGEPAPALPARRRRVAGG